MIMNPAVRRMVDDNDDAAERVESGDIEFAPTYVGLKYVHERVAIEIAFANEDDDGNVSIAKQDDDNAFPSYVLWIDDKIVCAIDVSEEMHTTSRIFNAKIQEHTA